MNYNANTGLLALKSEAQNLWKIKTSSSKEHLMKSKQFKYQQMQPKWTNWNQNRRNEEEYSRALQNLNGAIIYFQVDEEMRSERSRLPVGPCSSSPPLYWWVSWWGGVRPRREWRDQAPSRAGRLPRWFVRVPTRGCGCWAWAWKIVVHLSTWGWWSPPSLTRNALQRSVAGSVVKGGRNEGITGTVEWRAKSDRLFDNTTTSFK